MSGLFHDGELRLSDLFLSGLLGQNKPDRREMGLSDQFHGTQRVNSGVWPIPYPRQENCLTYSVVKKGVWPILGSGCLGYSVRPSMFSHYNCTLLDFSIRRGGRGPNFKVLWWRSKSGKKGLSTQIVRIAQFTQKIILHARTENVHHDRLQLRFHFLLP